MAFAVAMNEWLTVMTSSPAPTPTASSARCSAVVQLETAHACGAPTYSANSRSNAATSGPCVTQPDRITRRTASTSRSSRIGFAIGNLLHRLLARLHPVLALALMLDGEAPPAHPPATAGTGPARRRRSQTAATSCVTTAPAPTMAPRPMVTPGRIVAFVPMSAHAPMRTGLISRSVCTMGTSAGTPVCAEPSTFAPGPQPDVVLEDEVARVHVGLRTDPDVIADDRRAVEAPLDVGLRADEHAVADLERLEVLEADAAADLQSVAAAARRRRARCSGAS